MTAEVGQHRWSTGGFLRAWEAGAFADAQVEMIDGDLWPVSIGSWHGDTTARVTRTLPNGLIAVSTQSLVLSSSVVDPDIWVRPVEARLYAAAGFGIYWVLARDAVHEYTDPTPFGYRSVRRYWPGDRLPIPWADGALDVAALVGTDAGS